MKKDKEEFVYADKSTGKSWLILFFVYLLVLIWLEPLIDTLLTLNPPDKELGAIQAFNAKKNHIATLAFGIARSLPILLFLWLAYRVLLTGQVPPKKLKIPFTVKVIKGEQARMAGISMIALGLILLFRELFIMINA